MSFADRAFFLRKDAGLSQKQLADKLRISASSICQLELKKREPSCAILSAYSNYFNVSIEFLLEINTERIINEFSELLKDYNELKNNLPTEKEKALLKAFSSLLPETQDFVLRTVQSLSDTDSTKSLKKF